MLGIILDDESSPCATLRFSRDSFAAFHDLESSHTQGEHNGHLQVLVRPLTRLSPTVTVCRCASAPFPSKSEKDRFLFFPLPSTAHGRGTLNLPFFLEVDLFPFCRLFRMNVDLLSEAASPSLPK